MSCVNGGIVTSSELAPQLVIVTGIIGIVFAAVLLFQVSCVKLDVRG